MKSDCFEKTIAVVCFVIAMAFFALCIWSVFWQVPFSKIGIIVGIAGAAFFGNFGLNLWHVNQNRLDEQMNRSSCFSRLKE